MTMRRVQPQKNVARTPEARPTIGRGEPLAPSTRAAMERRFAHDFGNVRIHADGDAARSAASLGAFAWTRGRDVVFGAGAYTPDTPRGALLLAHELAHVIQQEGLPDDPRATPRLGNPEEATERVADDAAHAAMAEGSPALALRAQLRASAPASPVIQRAITTWAGEFATTTYTKYQNKAIFGGNVDGVTIDLEFRPNDKVDSKKIGMVQTAITKVGGALVVPGTTDAETATYLSHAAPAGGHGEGRQIDQSHEFANPLYATGAAKKGHKLASTQPEKKWGQHGHRYIDAAGNEQKQPAQLTDEPHEATANTVASQNFESTALAIDENGPQYGTYYGSVSWGWERDSTGAVSKHPLTRVSKDAPSGAFNAAARQWNVSKTSTGQSTIDLPVVTRSYVRANDTPVVQDPAAAPAVEIGKLDKNTRVEVVDRGQREAFNKGAATPWWKVTVVEGVDIGKVGWTLSSDLSPKVIP
ncbi:MAG TPA: DUF4157 domain-containing protein [Thermoanaerobaculia bacterium]|nr:DUF4157 domain-containing protein [Thermoanaerobaculia bacterium]